MTTEGWLTKYFTPEDTWNGGFFELAMELGPRSDRHLDAALRVVWEHETLEGCYLRGDLEPSEHQRVPPACASLGTRAEEYCQGHLYGLAMLPNGKRVACGTIAIREDDGPDWLDFYVPMGALVTAYEAVAGYPFSDPDLPRAGANARLPFRGTVTTKLLPRFRSFTTGIR